MIIFYIRSGINQNDASTYSITKLYVEQPNAQPNAQADEQASEHIITKLNLLFYFIYNNASGEKIGLDEKDREALILIFDRLEMYVNDINSFNSMPYEVVINEKILMWVVKEIYLSPYRIFINKLDRQTLVHKFLKSKKYIERKQDFKLEELISYCITCLQKELKYK